MKDDTVVGGSGLFAVCHGNVVYCERKLAQRFADVKVDMGHVNILV